MLLNGVLLNGELVFGNGVCRRILTGVGDIGTEKRVTPNLVI
jgi:hypothetical protein